MVPVKFPIRFLITACLILTGSCSTEFDTYVTGLTTPVVYGVINPADSLYQIRLTKSFVGEGSALDFARIPDSIYYADASVVLETYLANVPYQSIQLEQVTLSDRSPGIFASSPNYIYQTSQRNLHIDYSFFEAMGIAYDMEIKLSVIIPGQTDTIRASSRLLPPPRIIHPRPTYKKVYFYGDVPFQLEWTHPTQGNYYELQVVAWYKEITATTESITHSQWILKGIEYNESSYPGSVNNKYSYFFRAENFFAQLAAAVEQVPELTGRVLQSIDFIILTSESIMKEYNRVGAMQDDYHGAGYTNITNGLGMFTNYNKTGVYDMSLGQRELDSLANGRYTRHLKFKNW